MLFEKKSTLFSVISQFRTEGQLETLPSEVHMVDASIGVVRGVQLHLLNLGRISLNISRFSDIGKLSWKKAILPLTEVKIGKCIIFCSANKGNSFRKPPYPKSLCYQKSKRQYVKRIFLSNQSRFNAVFQIYPCLMKNLQEIF